MNEPHTTEHKSKSHSTKNVFVNSNFPDDLGEWTFTFMKGQELKSENLNDFLTFPGVKITNSHHEFGYKFNKLYQRWNAYNFLTNNYI